LQWHALWHLILGGGEFLKTNWDWVLAIVFLVLTIRTLLFPVFVKQIKSQRAMQAIAPQIKELQAKHKGDRETLQREMMDLYKREKANPLMGCLPMVVQIPVMWALFHVLRHLNPNRAAVTKQIYGWTINQFDSAASARLFGAPIAASFKSTAADLADMQANGTTVKIVAGALVADMILGRKSKPAAKGTAANANGAPKVDGKALAPKPGAKPVNPKRGTPAKSPAAQGAAGSRADDGSRATGQGGAAKAKGTAGQGA